MSIDASVIICTYNRASSLIDTLKSLSEMEVAKDWGWEILVIDNNSHDQTKRMVKNFSNSSELKIRYLLEPNQGQSYARNTGIKAAEGEYIVFTDDDVLVERNWLNYIIKTFKEYDADCVGGKILPYWLEPRPSWLSDDLLNVLAMLDYGEEIFSFKSQSDQRILFGANMSFKKETLVRLGMFDVDLGRIGKYGCGDDQDMFLKFRDNNAMIIYNPNIIVKHKVFPERLTKSYFRNWHSAAGKDRAKITKKSKIKIFGIEDFLILGFIQEVSRFLSSVLRGRSELMFKHELKLILHLKIFQHKLFMSNRKS